MFGTLSALIPHAREAPWVELPRVVVVDPLEVCHWSRGADIAPFGNERSVREREVLEGFAVEEDCKASV